MFATLPPLLYPAIFLCLTCAFSQRVAPQNPIRCIERERQALLDFKHGLEDDYGLLSSWGSSIHQRECCNWWGVHCNNNTAHVTILDIHAPLDDHGFILQLKGSKVSQSLLQLKHLVYLDLSNNDFQGNPIPEFIGSFGGLRVLSLMDANFAGTVPCELGNLTNLRVLNITGGGLKMNNLEWLSRLSSLRSIDLSGNDFSGSPKTIVSLPPFLEKLRFSSCYGLDETLPFSLNSPSPFLSIVDFSENNLITFSSVFHLLRNVSKQLTSINLSGNILNGSIPDALGDMNFLESLILDWNFFTNGIPKSFGNLTHLQILSLGNNQLNESIADLFKKLSGKSLQILELSFNNLSGEIPVDIGIRFPSLRILHVIENQLNGSCFTLPSSLEELDLSRNKIRGLLQDMKCFGQECDLIHLNLADNQITGQFFDLSHLPSLTELDVSGNQITGHIPDLSHVLSLTMLDLSENHLQWGLPETMGKLSKLERLYVSSNSLEGVLTDAHFSNLTNLQYLGLSFNAALYFNLSDNWVPPFQIKYFSCANCKVGPQFPRWLQNQTTLDYLDISNGSISDTIPRWFWKSSMSSKSFYGMNLSYNNIGGRIPDSVTNFTADFTSRLIDLSYNNIWGPIPLLPDGISILHLSNNKLSGPISLLCSTFDYFSNSIDLSYNQLSGEIPDCWNNSTKLLILNLGNNRFSGKIPDSLGSMSIVQSLHLRNNHLTGELPSSLQNCTLLKVMDFGGNQFTGRIPAWIGGSLMDLVIVSLQDNKFHGEMPSNICYLKNIQILDFFENKFTGKIPQCFNNFTLLLQKNNSKELQYDFSDFLDPFSVVYIDNILIQWKNQEWNIGSNWNF
ncbi:receptor-like protein EIX2 [Ipomoea triloba]|uniref:receptor-like protein EIX2 n=1 Tax=Ipomoea triloba TaxID=35885 RepID=UPI00125E79EC|nr:receptor-like protein EIX2 [Ipomoea triloba]